MKFKLAILAIAFPTVAFAQNNVSIACTGPDGAELQAEITLDKDGNASGRITHWVELFQKGPVNWDSFLVPRNAPLTIKSSLIANTTMIKTSGANNGVGVAIQLHAKNIIEKVLQSKESYTDEQAQVVSDWPTTRTVEKCVVSSLDPAKN